MRNPEVPQCQIDKNSFPNSTFRSEDEFIKGLQFSYPKPLDFFNLKLFLLNQTPGSERVNFIAKIVQNHPSEIKEVFKDLVTNGLKIKLYIPRKSEVLRDSVIKLIDDFINEDSNFPVHEGSHKSKNIFIAINACKINLVKAILERDPDSINATNSQNKSPIHIVVSKNNKNLLQELLKYPSLDLYAKCNATNHDKSASSQLNVFDIAKTKNNLEIIQILENEHQMRLMAENPNAIEFEKHRVPKEIASSSINPETSQASPELGNEPVMPWEMVVWEDNNDISQSSDQQKITLQDKQKIDEIIATSLVEILNNIQTQTPGGGAMIGDIRGLSSDFSLAPLNTPLTEASTQITDPINENHEVKDSQSISSSIGPDTSSQSAFRPFKRTKTSSVVASISSLEAGQSIDYGEQITSRISPTSQESLSGSHKGQGGSK